MDVSIIVPTYNEKDNIPILAERLFEALKKASIEGELVIVDDGSPDGTGDVAEKLGKKYPVTVVHRSGKLGLSSAVLEGFAMATGDYLGVMDADLSHPPEVIPQLVAAIKAGADLAPGTRYAQGGGVEHWPLHRQIISKVATMLAQPLTPLSDPMSGLFMIKREVIEDVTLNPLGFKILLEIAVKGHVSKITEVPFTFKDRLAGESKLNSKEQINYLKHLFALYRYRYHI
ncbi:Glycosyltransferase AglD [uncultured archaeon]|nr:Glycosyltransferase AglD [uncultured archaeon]